MLSQLQEKSKTELLSYIDKGKQRARSALAKAEKPALQFGNGMAAILGGGAGGFVAGMKPEVVRVPTDALVGLVIALPCLLGAESPAVNAIASAGYGMLSGAASRAASSSTRNWREQRAADQGDQQAAQIVQMQKQLNDMRKARENPAVKK